MSETPSSPPPAADRGQAALVAAFGALMLLLMALMALAFLDFRELSRANRWSIHTYDVLAQTEGMRGAAAEMETALRGFGLSGEPRFAAAWRAGAAEFDDHAAAARRLVADNPLQQRRLEAMMAIERRWREMQQLGIPDEASPQESVLAAQGRVADRAAFSERTARGDSIRGLLALMERSEFDLLRSRADRASALERRTGWLLGGGGLFAVLLAGGAGALALRRTAGLRRANRLLTAEAAERMLARRAGERLARQNELILHAAAEGIYGVDAHGYTTFVNPAAAEMLGYAAEALPGRPYEALLAGSADGDPIRAALLSGEVRTERNASFRRADGRRFPVEFTCTPIVEDDHIGGAVITFRDVTERRAVDRMKDEFVSVVSHELRTPLTAIRGSLGLLAAGKAGEVPERGRRMLDIAVQNTDRLIRLINDILDLERIESGMVAMELSPVDAADLLRHAAEVMQPMAERAGVELRVQVQPVPLVADADRLLQVLTNLVSNAVKFSPEGARVELGVEAVDGEARFRVADQGRGIPADRLESIFERFQQVDSSDSRQKGGTGLGLAICRTIVDQHGGRIWAESEPGQGSTFRFVLPLAEAAAPSPAAPGTSALAAPSMAARPFAPGRTVPSAPPPPAPASPSPGAGDDAAAPGEFTVGEEDGGSASSLSLPEMEAVAAAGPADSTPTAADYTPDAPAGADGAGGEPATQDGRRRVLVVEDDADLAGVLAETFERRGVVADVAGTGAGAWSTARLRRPDAVVLDLALPDGDGYEVAERFRGDAGLRAVPILAYTALDVDEGSRERLRRAGVDVLTKGRVEPGELERRVMEMLAIGDGAS